MPTIRRGRFARRLRPRHAPPAQPAAPPGMDAGIPAAARRDCGWRARALVTHRLVRPRPSRRPASRSSADPGQVPRPADWLSANDLPPTHLAARLGIPTLLLLGPSADWLWGPRTGASPLVPDAGSAARGRDGKAGGAASSAMRPVPQTLRKRSNPRPRNRPPMAADGGELRPHPHRSRRRR